MSTLSERIREALVESGVTQADLVRATGAKAASVSNWVGGRTKNLKGENLVAAAQLLGVEEAWLASGVGPKRRAGKTSRENKIDGGQNGLTTAASPLKSGPQWPFERVSASDIHALPKADRERLESMLAKAIAEIKSGPAPKPLTSAPTTASRIAATDDVELPFPMEPMEPKPWAVGLPLASVPKPTPALHISTRVDVGHLASAGYSANDHEFTAVPELDVRLAAGRLGIENYTETQIGEILLRRSFLQSFGLPIERMKIVYGEGDSMEPVIRHQAPMLFFEEAITDMRLINPRTVYAINRGGRMLVKCIARNAVGIWVARSLNPVHEDFTLAADDGREVRIVGRILWSPYDLRNGVDERLVRR